MKVYIEMNNHCSVHTIRMESRSNMCLFDKRQFYSNLLLFTPFPTFQVDTRPRVNAAAIYTTKIDGVVCQPNISETVAVRTVKLAHRPRIASTTINFISRPILLYIL